MKILKYVGISIIGLIALLLIIPIFLPSSVTVSRSASINAPVDSVYNFVANFNNFESWSPWRKYDTTAKISVVGQTGIGQKYSWVGNDDVGTGSMTTTRLQPGKEVGMTLEFIAPWQSTADVSWQLEADEKGTKVNWVMKQDMPYFEKYFGLALDKMVGGDFEVGLANLKNKFEK